MAQLLIEKAEQERVRKGTYNTRQNAKSRFSLLNKKLKILIHT